MPQASNLRDLEHWGKMLQGRKPGGEDLSLDSEFELLQGEVGKEASVHDDQKTDWVIVYELADSILARSKDLWALAYGSVAVYYTKSATDCARVLNIMGALIVSQWDTLYPSLKRPKRRLAPLKWLHAKFRHIADSTNFLGVAPTDLTALNEAFLALQKALDSVLPNNDLAFRTVLREQMAFSEPTIEDTPKTSLQEATKQSPASVSKKTKLQSNNPSSEAEKSITIPPAILPQIIRSTNDNSYQLADHLLAIKNTHDAGYLLHRISWYTLPQLPPADADGLTQMNCPVASDVIDTLTSGVNNKQYAETLPLLEKAASKAIFWLDGHYLVVRCLEGISAEEAARAIKHSLVQLVKRFPDIITLKFKEGRPFASAKTIAWIDSLMSTDFGTELFAVSGKSEFPGSGQGDEHELLQEALSVKGESDFKAGLEHLGKVQPGRSRAFIKHCILRARYCIAAGTPQPAVTILQTIFDKLKEWDLLDWEPEITAEAVSLLVSLKNKQQKGNDELLAVLHMVSLETAISTTKGKSS